MSLSRYSPDFIDQQGSHDERIRRLEAGIGIPGPGYEVAIYERERDEPLTSWTGKVCVGRYGNSVHMWCDFFAFNIEWATGGGVLLTLPEGWAPLSRAVANLHSYSFGADVLIVETSGLVHFPFTQAT